MDLRLQFYQFEWKDFEKSVTVDFSSMFRRVHVAYELLNSKHIGQIFVTAFPKNWHERSKVNDDLLTFPILDIYKVYSSENF